MLIRDAQEEVRSIYRRGSVGQLVSGLLWLVSASLATWVDARSAMILLIVGGILIFPLTQLVLKLLGGRASLQKGNPLNGLAMQVAFIVPLCIPVILWAAGNRLDLFYPAFMIVVGAHYLPFIFLYGMPEFAVLAGALLFGGIGIAMFLPGSFALGGWFTGIVLVLFAAWAALAVARKSQPA